MSRLKFPDQSEYETRAVPRRYGSGGVPADGDQIKRRAGKRRLMRSERLHVVLEKLPTGAQVVAVECSGKDVHASGPT